MNQAQKHKGEKDRYREPGKKRGQPEADEPDASTTEPERAAAAPELKCALPLDLVDESLVATLTVAPLRCSAPPTL